MGDYDREPERVRETERTNTTIVQTDGGRRGGGGVLVAVILLIAVLVLLFFLFGPGLNRAADEVGVNVNVEAPSMPDVKMPDVDINVPDVNVSLPDVDVDTKPDGNSG
jgi:hypothetical protein